MITKRNLPIYVAALISFAILMCAACVYEAHAEERIVRLHTYMEIIIYQPGFEISLMDEKGSVYATYDYPSEVYFTPKAGDIAIVQMQFEYVGQQLFNLRHLKVVNIIPR